MYPTHAKIIKRPGEKVDEFESTISQALLDIECNGDLKAQLRELYIVGAKELDVDARKAIVVWIPPPQLRAWQKLHVPIVRELEKKFSGKPVVFVSKRTILPKPTRKVRSKSKQKRPRSSSSITYAFFSASLLSRTLTAVHDAILADIVYPAEIVGKRTRICLDGKRIFKIHLDKTSQTNIEHKTDTISAIYKKLTGKEVQFQFPDPLF